MLKYYENNGIIDAFSSPHVIGYTMVAMQEMNLCLRYGSIWWKTGCLKVDSGMIGEDIKTTKYGDIARAVSTMISDVRPPDINKSQWGFEIVPEENKIYYGFLPITGIGKKEIETIIENRPYKSFKDFFLRVAQPNLLSPKKVLTLIKAGCFDSFNANRRQVAEVFIRAIVPRAEKVTLTSINTFKNELRRKEMYVDIVDLWEFKKMAVGKKAKMNKNLEQVFISKYSNYVDYDYINGKLVIDEKSFDKYYKQQVKPLQEYLKTNEAKDMITNIKRREMWLENCGGNVSSWEMETLDLYFTKHELEIAPINKYFKLSNFSELPENPKPISYNKWRGNQFPVYDTCQIAGTVIDKNKVKNIVYLLTTDGVVTLKIPSGQFNYYDRMVVEVKNGKKRVIEKSWFEKGSILVVNGYRKETNFFVKKAKNQKHGIMKINRYNQNQIEFLSERKKV